MSGLYDGGVVNQIPLSFDNYPVVLITNCGDPSLDGIEFRYVTEVPE